MTHLDPRFAFGANWQSFVNTAVDEQRITTAVKSVQQLLKVQDLQGESFLDIGCGSGLFSLAAFLLGAERVVSFDYDPNSVEASITLRERANVPAEKWQVLQGSILDKEFLGTLDPVDVVYSWGVLHHTGAMWQAMDNAVSKVRPGGIIAISIYNKVDSRVGGSAMWWWVKRAYNRSPQAVRRLMEYIYVANFMLRRLLTLRNPFKAIRHYGSSRGMDFWHDVRDWLGGFPYEYATAGEVFNYLHDKFGLQLEYLSTHHSHSCNEFVFRRVV